jgi:2-C-methyl-D-erythritol 4-phosphate cytidylyltransferase / 2-C-methyl-D-erythritol 2,4-cyclodiphosphate synthase
MSGRESQAAAPHSKLTPSLPLSGSTFLLLTAAGSSSRFGESKKELVSLGEASVLQRSLEAFLHIQDLAGILVTYPEGKLDAVRAAIEPVLIARINKETRCGLNFVAGGVSRQESVAKGLETLCRLARDAGLDIKSEIVLVHDAARPWVSRHIIDAVLASTRLNGACVPLIPLADTPKIIADGDLIETHPSRDFVMAAQTPQGFALEALAAAHSAARAEGWTCTDDSSLWARYAGPAHFVAGDRKNKKITYREDLAMDADPEANKDEPDEDSQAKLRIGEGWDVHRLVAGRKLLLGGVRIEHDRGEEGHSDGDVLWHAIIDALLGACGLGDIGSHFSPADTRWKDADSGQLAKNVFALVTAQGWRLCNLDSTVILERPKLGPHREAICANIASTLGVPRSIVSVKAKTYEGLGEVGRGEAVEARAVVLLESSGRLPQGVEETGR